MVYSLNNKAWWRMCYYDLKNTSGQTATHYSEHPKPLENRRIEQDKTPGWVGSRFVMWISQIAQTPVYYWVPDIIKVMIEAETDCLQAVSGRFHAGKFCKVKLFVSRDMPQHWEGVELEKRFEERNNFYAGIKEITQIRWNAEKSWKFERTKCRQRIQWRQIGILSLKVHISRRDFSSHRLRGGL